MKDKQLLLIMIPLLSLTACSEPYCTVQTSVDSAAGTNVAIEDLQIVGNADEFHDVIDEKYQINYTKIIMDREPFRSVEEMMAVGDTVIIGRVTDITFMTHPNLSQPQSESQEMVLSTLYDVDILHIYKGNAENKLVLHMSGGLDQSEYLQKEIEVMGNQPVTEIKLYLSQPKFEIGKTYLLVLRENTAFPGHYNPFGYSQSVCPISSNKDAAYSAGFSMKDIISYFESDEWNSFHPEEYLT